MSIITPEMYDDFDVDKIIFEQAKQFSGPNGSKFNRIFIRYKYDDNNVDGLVLQTPILFTWGINMGKQFSDSDFGTPQLSLVTYNAAVGPTNQEQQFLNICTAILNAAKDHLRQEQTKEELDKWDMESDVNSMKLFYIKTEKGKPVKGYPPTLYSKLYFQKPKGGEPIITTRISDAKTGEDLPQSPLLGFSNIYATLIFTNIFIGAKPSMQTRIGEIMVVEKKERKRYLKPIATEPEVDVTRSSVTSVPLVRLKNLKKQR